MTKAKERQTQSPHHIQISSTYHPKEDALTEYDRLIEGGLIKNFLILFGYPFTIYYWNDFKTKNNDPCIYFETASSHVVKLCQRAHKHRHTVYLGYFTDQCNFQSVYVDGKIQSIHRAKPCRSVRVNKQKALPLKTYRIQIKPKKWVFGVFVASSAQNTSITDSNFNVQRKTYYRNNTYVKTKYTVSPCDDIGKEEIFTYTCDLPHTVETHTTD